MGHSSCSGVVHVCGVMCTDMSDSSLLIVLSDTEIKVVQERFVLSRGCSKKLHGLEPCS